MIAGMLEKMVQKVTIDPGTIAILLEASLGLAIAVLLGQIFAFQKYIKLNEPVYQIFAFIFTKLYTLVINGLKYLGLTVVVFVGLHVIGFFMGVDYFFAYRTSLSVFYGLCALGSFALGFSTERTRSLNENMITKA